MRLLDALLSEMDALAPSADVLGKQKLAYDLWGDTVNTGNRIESHGLIGRLQCTE